MRRILALWLPLWPIDQWRRALGLGSTLPASAFALTETLNQTQKLYAVCSRAATLGLVRGMTLAEARAIRPDIAVEPANLERDAVQLEQLARWLVRYTPLTAVDGADGILLDVTGCPHLFGGEKAMMAGICARLEAAGISVQAAMAENRAAAWALARFRPGSISNSPETSQKWLSPLPIRAMRLDGASELTLKRLGLKTIGSLFDLPRASVAKRFRGHPSKAVTALLTRLDQLLGRKDEPMVPLVPLPSWRVQQAFAEPAQHLPMIEAVVSELIERLIELLSEAEQGVRRMILHAFRVDGSVQDLMVGTNRPSRDKPHLTRLLLEQLDQLEAEFGFDLIMLSAHETEHMPPEQMGDRAAQHNQSASELMDRLAVRLGPYAISRLKHHESHLPERSQQLKPAHETDLNWESLPKNQAPRPIRLLLRPEEIDVLAEVPEGAPRRFRWRRVEHRITKAEGPERIACEWWLTPEAETRDYYRVEAESGARFWLFRYGLYGVAGVRHAETDKPAWFMHGFFA